MTEKKDSKSKVIELIEKMSVLELSDLIKELEEKFGVKSAPVIQTNVGVSAPTEAKAAVEEKTEFEVVLKSFGERKIPVIKTVREITNLGLKEAKDLVEGAPCTIKGELSKEEAESIAKKIRDAGGVCEIK